MAANVISQLTTSNTFQQWLGATQLLIATANTLTNGNGESFFANTRLIVGGSGSNVSLNVQTSATINDLVGNTSNIITGTFRNLTVTQNVASLNVTSNSYFGQNVVVYGSQQIKGDLEVSGNLTLEAIGFDDLTIAGSGSFGNNLTVIGTTNLTGNLTVINANVTNTLVANIFTGSANTRIFDAISTSTAESIAFAIALG